MARSVLNGSALRRVVALGLGCSVALVSGDYYVPYAAEQEAMWSEFKNNFNLGVGATHEEDYAAKQRFFETVKLADARNGAEPNPVHGVTKFSSMGQAEFEALMLLDARPDPSSILAHAVDSPLFTPGKDGPVSRDWSGVLTTPVRDQGACASGWAFAAAAQIESDAQRLLGVRYVASPQQLLACDVHSDYCKGGWPEAGFAYVRRSGGVEPEASYPYVSGASGKQPSCHAVVDDFVISIEGPAKALSRETPYMTEKAMAWHVNNTGPLAVCVDATKWGTYTGGVIETCGSDVNHCLQVVGVQVSADGTGGWWRLRNSWGSSWGEGGHVRLRFGKDTCGITTRPTFVETKYRGAGTKGAFPTTRLRQAAD